MPKGNTPTVTVLPFSARTDEQVSEILRTHKIGLTVEEARKISALLGRDPTLVEAVIWGIQGSEHCSYKSSGRFLKSFPTDGKHVILGPGEDSGVVAITDGPKGKRWGLAISHESHNHPSQIVPYEGAATGVGGVVRDVVCMGARIVGCMDLLRLGDLQTEESRTIASEVARGIAGYGNPLGIPNLGGDTVFDATYNSNCLVNAIALGIVREDEIIHSEVPAEAGVVGYDIIIVGKPTDRSGFGGASFASASLEEEKKEQNTGAVQEPNPFLERHLLASTYALFDWLAEAKKLDKVSFKDLGAGGVVCASVEQVAERGFGAKIALDQVHVSVENLPPEMVACAETQERFCWICHPDLTEHILQHYNQDWDLPSIAESACASRIGHVTDDAVFQLTYYGETVCEAKALDITCGLQYTRPTAPITFPDAEPEIACKGDVITVIRSGPPRDQPIRTDGAPFETTIACVFKAILQHPNYASPARVIRHYDKNVIGNTIVEAGEADAGVIAPLQDLKHYVHMGTHPVWELPEEDRWRGVAVAGDGNGRYGRISPYLQGVNAAVEAMRNVASVGAKPRALTDCLNYGNPEIPEQLWQLEEGVRGIGDAAREISVEGEHIPVISGNVSLYNSKPDGNAIDPTAIVCCIGVLEDARRAITMQLTSPDAHLFLIGERRNECGGSAYYEILEQMSEAEHDALLGTNVPHPDFKEVSLQLGFITNAIAQGLVTACHDISNGGLLLALFEMMLPQRKTGGTIGVDVSLDALGTLRPDVLLFSETGGFIIEVPPQQVKALEEAARANATNLLPLGRTCANAQFTVRQRGQVLLQEDLATLHHLWKYGMKNAF